MDTLSGDLSVHHQLSLFARNAHCELMLVQVEGKEISDCCQACLVEVSCERYVLVEADGECYLKSAIAGDLKLTGDFTGIQSGMVKRGQTANGGAHATADQAASLLDYVTIEGHGLLGFSLVPAAARESAAACADWCSSSPGCMSFNYGTNNKLCQLSSSTKVESAGEGFQLVEDTTYNERRLQPTAAPSPLPLPDQLKMSRANTKEAQAELSEAQQVAFSL